MDRERLRLVFNDAAELYDRARPGYPAELFDDLAELARLRPGARVLEIGCGTGQATLPLAQRGYQVVALDLGPNMVAVARRALAPFPSVEVLNATFEDWPLPDDSFDAVVSATAFLWLDPAVRVTKAAAALRAGGSLAVISTHHVAGGSETFFASAQHCYERWDASTPPGLRLEPAAEVPSDSAELERNGRFRPAISRRYERDLSYSTSSYLDLLMTYSGHRALDDAARAGLLACIAHLIDAEYGGVVVKRYMNELQVAQLA